MLAKQTRPVKVPKAQELKLFPRRVFTEHDHLRVVYFRFNSLQDFSRVTLSFKEVAKVTSLADCTVRAILRRFAENGNKVVFGRKTNGRACTAKLQGPLKQWLLSKECLSMWSSFSL